MTICIKNIPTISNIYKFFFHFYNFEFMLSNKEIYCISYFVFSSFRNFYSINNSKYFTANFVNSNIC